MNALRKYTLLICAICISVSVYGQELSSKSRLIEQQIELIAEASGSEEIDFTTLFETLSFYYDNPLNLNTADAADIEALSILSYYQVQAILTYRNTFGYFTSIYELRQIDGLDYASIRMLMPFIQVNPLVEKSTPSLAYGSHQVLARYQTTLEAKRGYEDPNYTGAYLGDPNAYYLRYRFQKGTTFSAGITAEHDAGEPFGTRGNEAGADFYSAHAYYSGKGRIRQLVLGDFQAQFGQGLTFWSGLNFGQSADVFQVRRQARRLTPYTGANESLFLRGAGATIGITKNTELTLFYSSKYQDGNTLQDSLGNPTSVSSIQQTGLHRTTNSMDDKRSVQEQITGAHLRLRAKHIEGGITATRLALDRPLNRNLQLYNQFEFNGLELVNFGGNLNINLGKALVFSEASVSDNSAWAYLTGAEIPLHERFALIIYHRNFDRKYQSWYATPFAASSNAQNERGLYIGARAKVAPNTTIQGRVDRFKREWLSYLADKPSEGNSALLQVDVKPTRNTHLYARYRFETSSRNASENETNTERVLDEKRHALRLHLDAHISAQIRIRSRVEYNWYSRKPEVSSTGFLAYQDLIVSSKNKKMRFATRVALFDVSDFQSRIYAYENDVLYFFSVPSFNNRGMRTYLLWQYNASDQLALWIKIGRTYYTNLDEIGTGGEAITGSTKTDLRVQLRWKF